MDPSVAIQIIILIILLVLSAFFSSAETALTTANQIRIRAMADEGDKQARILLNVLEDRSKMLSTVLIGNNIVNLTASSLTTIISTTIAQKFFDDNVIGLAIGIATGLLTIIILIFGEITPKTAATINSERMALRYAKSISVLMTIFTPIIFLVNMLARGIMRILRIDPDAKKEVMTESELRTIVDVSHEEGVIETEEREMIKNVVDFGDTEAKEIMVPRVDMVMIPVDATYDEVLEEYKDSRFTRMPVYEDDKDNVIGIFNIKDLLICEDKEHFDIRNSMREAYYTHEHKKTGELLIAMRNESLSIAIIFDEYGAAVGMITMEDLLEEIVGDIQDEFDVEEDTCVKVGPREYIVDGSMHLTDLSEELDFAFESEDYDSIAGLVIEHMDDLPEEGESCVTDTGARLVVDKMDKNRIEKVHIYLPEFANKDLEKQADEEKDQQKKS